MEQQQDWGNLSVDARAEEDLEEFQSCCEDAEIWQEKCLDEFSAKMCFKGVSVAEIGDFGSTGIGVIMERPAGFPVIQVQKKLEFYVDPSIATYLALMDGLVEAIRNNITGVYASTDSQLLYDQICCKVTPESSLLVALREKILEHTSKLQHFVLTLVPESDLMASLQLAKLAIGVVSPATVLVDTCCICHEDKTSQVMIRLKCRHIFCSHCLRIYVDLKVQRCCVPIRCPRLNCKYYMSLDECESFLVLSSYESFKEAVAQARILQSDRIYCPFPKCSALIHRGSDDNCVQCPVCERFICVGCVVPWHGSMTCEVFKNLPALNYWSTRCQECHRMVEMNQVCFHVTCQCGHEFCYSCGAEFRHGQQICGCGFNGEEKSAIIGVEESHELAWEKFYTLPMIIDTYSDQERWQLALIQRFLAGGHHSQ